MKVANFYPGPSRVYSNITEYIYEAYMDGIMSVNHRSEDFMNLMELTKKELREKLQIPADYEIAFISSATENWEIIAQSLTQKASQHFYNGAFGEKWASYAGKLTSTINTHFGINEELPTGDIAKKADVLCVTQNETSNATQVSMKSLKMLREENVGKIIAVDVTSSLGGVKLDFTLADAWYASVQKCLGLPAGMGVMILSPFAVQTAEKIGERDHYNSLLNILENTRKNQTQYTPNVLGIYLLYKTQQATKGIDYIESKLEKRMEEYGSFVDSQDQINYLITNEKVRSRTVLALETSRMEELKSGAKEQSIILGNGYGPWKSSTFRVANFPAIKNKEVEKLMEFLRSFTGVSAR
ncbi:aminotransferase class V-fold PLP-dependent enzyme [Marinoscillum luteum]|uniref:phosphoserine transaminase n=1 Tax=Marinoscillum luteum TaxID=861051 RepID=A0ABW7N9A8_9BACT